MSKERNKTAIFISTLFPAGGLETWVYNVASIYGKTHDITLYYERADRAQLLRLAKLIRCVEYTGQTIKCDTGIWCYDPLGLATTTAKRKIHIIHSDYGYSNNSKIRRSWIHEMDEVYAVSKLAAMSASKALGINVGVLYNPVLPNRKQTPIKIVSGTRLTPEKGLCRMKALAKALDNADVDYQWDIYTPSYKTVIPFSRNVTIKKPIMSMLKNIEDADFLVQLSDTESFGYSIVEAMVLGTKVVVTKVPVLRELGINKNNAIIVPLKKKNYKNIVKKIISQAPYTPPKSDYSIILGHPSKVKYVPSVVKNISKVDVLIDNERWLEPNQVAVVDNYDGTNKCLKIIK